MITQKKVSDRKAKPKKKKINMKRGNTEERLRRVTISLSCNF